MILFMAMLAIASGAAINRPVANMYSGPSEDKDVVSQALYGWNVDVLEQSAGWSRIRTPDAYTGWVPSDAVVTGKLYARSGQIAQVDTLFAHLYREPSVTKHAPVLTVPFETRLEITGEKADWLSVRLVDDRTAWVQRGDIVVAPGTLSIPEAIALAKKFMGLPYTWGGTSSFGFDCSGFMQMLCRRRGYTIPRDAQPQAEWSGMTAITTEQLQPGDLLYFGSSEKKITHTGMYIGNGEFIHATTHDEPVVQISRLADPHWTKLLVACRRVK